MRYLIPLIITFLLYTLATYLVGTHPAWGIAVMVLGLASAMLTIGLVLFDNAPVGYQDKDGFHYGKPKQ